MKFKSLFSILCLLAVTSSCPAIAWATPVFQDQPTSSELTKQSVAQDDQRNKSQTFDELNLDRPWNWSTQTPAEAGIQFKMPDKPRMSERMFKPAEDQPAIRVRNYIGTYRQGKMIFVVNYHDLPVAPSQESIDLILESALVGSVANVNGKILKNGKIRYGENPGREFHFRFAHQDTIFVGMGRVFMVNQRQYLLSLMMPEDDFSEWLAKEFLNSFRLVEGDPRKPGLEIFTAN